jgi:hypothetical protein
LRVSWTATKIARVMVMTVAIGNVTSRSLTVVEAVFLS